MADLRTRYLGLELRSPLVASASPLTGSLDGLARLEAAGAGAVVLPSLFEEELEEESKPAAYLDLISQAKRALSIPVVTSLNGVSRSGWVRYATRMEQAGADALELNIYYVSSRPGRSGSEIEWHYLDVVRSVRRAIQIPLAVKLSPYFSSLANMAGQLAEAGANGLVLFNRFYQPDLDLDSRDVVPWLVLSTSEELRLSLRWIAILYGRVGTSPAARPGSTPASTRPRVLLAGADVAMMTSALLRHGPEHVAVVERELRAVLAEHDSVSQLRGSMSRDAMPDRGRLRAGQLHAHPHVLVEPGQGEPRPGNRRPPDRRLTCEYERSWPARWSPWARTRPSRRWPRCW